MSYGEWLEFYLLYTRLVVVVHVIRVLVVVEFSEVGLCLWEFKRPTEWKLRDLGTRLSGYG